HRCAISADSCRWLASISPTKASALKFSNLCSSMPVRSDENRSLSTGVLGQFHQDRRVVARRLAFTLLADDLAVRDAIGERRRAEDEVDAHAAVLREAQLRVVPIGVYGGPRRERPHHIGELRVDDRVERRTLGWCDVCAVLIELWAPDVLVGGRDV